LEKRAKNLNFFSPFHRLNPLTYPFAKPLFMVPISSSYPNPNKKTITFLFLREENSHFFSLGHYRSFLSVYARQRLLVSSPVLSPSSPAHRKPAPSRRLLPRRRSYRASPVIPAPSASLPWRPPCSFTWCGRQPPLLLPWIAPLPSPSPSTSPMVAQP
jgi:hypothetical protein